MNRYVIRKRGMNHFVDRWDGLREDIPHARVFLSVEDAEFYCVQLVGCLDDYEVCELTPGGGVKPLERPGAAGP
jgi:hypothetical protein